MRRRKQAQRLIEECRELPIEPGGERRIGRVPLGLLQVVEEAPRFPSALAIRASEAQSVTRTVLATAAASSDPVKGEETVGDETGKRSFQHGATALAVAIFRSICSLVSVRGRASNKSIIFGNKNRVRPLLFARISLP